MVSGLEITDVGITGTWMKITVKTMNKIIQGENVNLRY